MLGCGGGLDGLQGVQAHSTMGFHVLQIILRFRCSQLSVILV